MRAFLIFITVLAFYTPAQAAKSGGIVVQFRETSVPTVALSGKRNTGFITLYLKFSNVESIRKLCDSMPKIREVLLIGLEKKPVPVLKGKYDLQGIPARIKSLLDKAFPKNGIQKLYAIQGTFRAGKGAIKLDISKVRRVCTPLEKIPPFVLRKAYDLPAVVKSAPRQSRKPDAKKAVKLGKSLEKEIRDTAVYKIPATKSAVKSPTSKRSLNDDAEREKLERSRQLATPKIKPSDGDALMWGLGLGGLVVILLGVTVFALKSGKKNTDRRKAESRRTSERREPKAAEAETFEMPEIESGDDQGESRRNGPDRREAQDLRRKAKAKMK